MYVCVKPICYCAHSGTSYVYTFNPFHMKVLFVLIAVVSLVIDILLESIFTGINQVQFKVHTTPTHTVRTVYFNAWTVRIWRWWWWRRQWRHGHRFWLYGTHEMMKKDGTIKTNKFMIACSFGYKYVSCFEFYWRKWKIRRRKWEEEKHSISTRNLRDI